MIELKNHYQRVRGLSEQIAAPLSPEDCVVQTMPDASPMRWHLAHTTWFFETFVLKSFADYQVFDSNFEYLFNSYYNTVGEQYPRPKRGLLSRPPHRTILDFRNYVDERMTLRLEQGDFQHEQLKLIELGLHHEQQHQELMVTDLKHLLYCNSLYPEYCDAKFTDCLASSNEQMATEAGVYEIGYSDSQFCFDNEQPRHQVFVQEYSIAQNLVSCGEYLEFMKDGGYDDPKYWLSLGWQTSNANGWRAPMYWKPHQDEWLVFTFDGWVPVNVEWPVCHVSYFEADAFARWKNQKLPTEAQWELASEGQVVENGSESFWLDQLLAAEKVIHPTRIGQGMLGQVWEWTRSSYEAYPGFAPAPGAVGEYNGKFMCNQYVLRGGSVATPSGHIRNTYRNFFPPETRWQFSGIRLVN